MKFLYPSNLNIEWNSFFRFSIALYCILSLFSFWEDIPAMLFQNASVSYSALDSCDSVLQILHKYITKHGFAMLFDDFVYRVIYAYLFVLGLLLLGAFTQIAALFAFLFNLIITRSIDPDFYEANYVATLALFFCVFFPRGKFSMDYHIKEFKINEISQKWSLYLLQTHLCIIYFFSGIDKGIGINWYNGESIWKAVSSQNYSGLISLSEFNIPNFVYAGFGIFILITETFYPFFINYSKTRKLWLAFTVSMHFSIIIFMGLYFFGTLMIILNVSAYYIPYLKNKKAEELVSEEEELAYQ